MFGNYVGFNRFDQNCFAVILNPLIWNQNDELACFLFLNPEPGTFEPLT